MQKNLRTSRQVVNNFLKSDSVIQADTLKGVVRQLRLDTRGGSMKEMEPLLQKALRGKRLFEFPKDGQTFYETISARRRRHQLPKWASKSKVINATEPAFA
jgi:hypothetical protein